MKAGNLGNSPPTHRQELKDRTEHAQAGAITLSFKLGLQDYFDRALFSLRVWVVPLGLTLILGGMCLYFTIFPPPLPPEKRQHVFLDFVVPFFLVVSPAAVCLGGLQGWLSNRRYQVNQTVYVSEEGITAESQHGVALISWAHFKGYRETWWSFILWRGIQGWMLIPKRSFNSGEDLARSRDLLARNVPRSVWFWG